MWLWRKKKKITCNCHNYPRRLGTPFSGQHYYKCPVAIEEQKTIEGKN